MVAVLLAATLGPPVSQEALASSTGVSYLYDEADQLVGVVDHANGSAATFEYDAAGNILSVDRHAATEVRVTEFAPNRGPVGSEVRILGTGFSATPSQNVVSFGGVNGSVSSATGTELVAVVPPGAATGRIQVTTPGGSHTSDDDFVVASDDGTPAISSVSAVVVERGGSLTITGQNFDTRATNNRVAIGSTLALVSGASATSLNTTVGPVHGIAGAVRVATPGGEAVGPDVFVPPAPYGANDVDATGRVAIDQSVSFTVGTPNRVSLLIFDGTRDQHVFVDVTASSFSTCPDLVLYSPDGERLRRDTCANAGDYFDLHELPQTGTYVLMVDPSGTTTGSLDLVVRDIQDIETSVTIDGGPITVTTSDGGQNAHVTFDAAAGQDVFVHFTDETYAGCTEVFLYAPGGTQVRSDTCLSSDDYFDTTTLPVEGTYEISIDPAGRETGSVILDVTSVPADAAAVTTVDGGALTVLTTAKGQNARVSFDATTGQDIFVHFTDETYLNCTDVFLYAPDGSTVRSEGCLISEDFFDTTALDQTGTYEILVDPDGAATGAVTLDVTSVPENALVTAVIDGGPVAVSTLAKGQNAQVSFEATAGAAMFVHMTDDTYSSCSPEVHLKAPDGTIVVSDTCVIDADYVDQPELPQTGTYEFLVNPDGATTGSITFDLTTVPADATATATIDGGPASVSTDAKGQNAHVYFDGAAGQRLSLLIPADSYSSCSPELVVLAPSGTQVVADSCVFSGDTYEFELTETGTYEIALDPDGATTGSLTVDLVQIIDDVVATATIDGGPVTLETTVAGQNAHVFFDATAGDAVFVHMTNDTYSNCSPEVHLKAPDGTTVVSNTCVLGDAYFDQPDLSQTGTYELFVDPDDATTGSITFDLTTVPADATATATVDGGPVSISTTAKGQNAHVSFDAAAGQSVRTDLSDDTYSSCSPEVYLKAPDGATLDSNTCVLGSGSLSADLTADGTYEVFIDPDDATTGSVTVAVVDTGGLAAASEGDDYWLSNTVFVSSRGTSRSLRGLAHLGDAHEEGDDAHSGSATLEGEVRTLKGDPLPGVTFEIEGTDSSTRSDDDGRFILSDLPGGRHELVIDGRSAKQPGKTYGVFEVGVDLDAGIANELGYTIWMPKLDTAHAVPIPSPTSEDLVITTPRIPGLELRIPGGTVITDVDGNTVTEISITEVPLDRPPFPLPVNVDTPVYFTIQPGGAYLSKGAQLVYPNTNGEPPGARSEFWDYDTEIGWHVYGTGVVSEDGSQIVPDYYTKIYEFTGAMFNNGRNPPDDGPKPPDEPDDDDGDPVDLESGLFVFEKTDLVLPDAVPVALTRTYRQRDPNSRPFGIGMSHPYEMFFWSADEFQELDLVLANGGRVHYDRISPGTGFSDAVLEHTGSPGPLYKSVISWNGDGWDIRLRDGTVFVMGENAPLQAIRDRYGNTTRIVREPGPNSDITAIRAPNGRWIEFTYDSGDRITEARDSTGRVVTYGYDANGRLTSVTDPANGVTTYAWDSCATSARCNRLLSITDPRGITFVQNQYDSSGRVTFQTLADGSTYDFDYTTDGSGDITQTEITDPNGNLRRVTFAGGHIATDTRAVGTPDEQTVTYERDASNFVTAVIDPLARRTEYGYDALGNLASVTRLAGTPDAVTSTFDYESTFSQPVAVTDPLGNTTSFGYDHVGNLTTVTDAAGKTTTLTTTDEGLPETVTDPLGHTTTFTYNAFNELTAVADPLGNTSTHFIDAAGRPVEMTDALGHTTTFTYDALHRPETVTDPLGNTTTFTYDANTNLSSVTDARGGTTTFTYDAMDRVASRTDAVGAAETFSYDASGNVAEHVDRRGTVTEFRYDALDRRTFTGYGRGVLGLFASSTTFEYDAGNRLTEAADSAGGTITLAYDTLDRLVSENTPQGTITYGYDAAGRRTTMTAASEPTVTYGYDPVGRLLEVAKGSLAGTYAYDDAGRLASLTLPNGVTATYQYDAGGRLTDITYENGSGPLGDLTYAYDATGRRTNVGGSLSRTDLPDAVATATYDSANRLTDWDGTPLTYDAEGNVTSIGSGVGSETDYTWNARGQLTSISRLLLSDASFAYDAFGRRSGKTVGTTTTQFLYDGPNPVLELQGGAVSAAMLTGLGVDAYLARTEGSTTVSYLRDALGSTVALTDSAGAIQTSYTYAPFGEATETGASASNSFRFTGREDDETGLHYFRARYYHPVLGRFISEDPIGFAGGDSNLYSYVGNSPTNFTDRSGLLIDVIVDAGFIGYDVVKLVTGGRKHLKENLQALAADVGGALLPFATGLGAGVRAARAADHADDTVDAAKAAKRGRDRTRPCSFDGDTEVVMGDGSTKPISQIQVGDAVLAADPETGERRARKVTHVWIHQDQVVDLKVDGGHVATTEDHPFWNETDSQWQRADSLGRGDFVVSADGNLIEVDGIDPESPRTTTAYNLTVDDVHTYFVQAGTDSVLVHNTCGKWQSPEEFADDLIRDTRHKYRNLPTETGQHGSGLRAAARELREQARTGGYLPEVRDKLLETADRWEARARGIDHPGRR